MSAPRTDLTAVLTAVPPAVRDTFRRYRPGTVSATIESIRLTDGRSVRTDLIRLNPNLECYSLDLDGAAPRATAHYTVTPWAEADELQVHAHDVATILRASYPAVGLAELTDRVRRTGYPLGAGTLQAHEAIAATQAALWHVTNGVRLDTRPVAAPVAVAVRHGGEPEALPLAPERPTWVGAVRVGRDVSLQLTMADRVQLGGYSVVLAAHSRLDGVRVHLQRSSDGASWTPVPSSSVAATGATLVHKVLGVGATVGDGHGYAHYRVVVSTGSPTETRIGVEEVRLTPAGSPAYPNPDRVVHLYEYLTAALGRAARARTDLPVRMTRVTAPIRRAHRVVRPNLVGGVAASQRVSPQLLLGASAPGAPARFTPVVRLAPANRKADAMFLMDLAAEPDRIRRVDWRTTRGPARLFTTPLAQQETVACPSTRPRPMPLASKPHGNSPTPPKRSPSSRRSPLGGCCSC